MSSALTALLETAARAPSSGDVSLLDLKAALKIDMASSANDLLHLSAASPNFAVLYNTVQSEYQLLAALHKTLKDISDV